MYPMANKSSSNDFFNLKSSSEDEDDVKNQEVIEKAIRKWDWDRKENFNLYYGYKNNNQVIKKRNLLVSADYEPDDGDEELNPKFKKACLTKFPDQDSKYYIEEVTNSQNLKFILNGHKSPVHRIHWGTKYLNRDMLLSSSMDAKCIIWNLSSKDNLNNQIRVFSDLHSKAIRNAVWSLHETEIISASFDQSSVLAEIESGKEIVRFKHNNILTAVCVHPCDENIILLGSKNEILAWDIRGSSTKPFKVFKSKSAMGQVQDIQFLNQSEFLSCGDVVSKESAEYSIIAWDFASNASISNQIFHEKYICTCLKKHPFNSLFYAQTHGNYIAEFSSRPPYKMNKFKRFESKNHLTEGYSIGFDLSSSGCLLAGASRDGFVYLYNTNSGKLINKIEAFNKDISSQVCLDAKFQPKLDSNSVKETLATSSWNGTIKIFSF